MSLPREIQEELLSAYLDDALRGDERTRVEQMLASDEDVQSLLEQMRSVQASTKAAMRSNRRPSDGFSQRVVAAAMAQAEQTQLPAQHHVRIAASRASETSSASPRKLKQQYRPVAVALALAASLLLAVTLWNSVPDPDGQPDVANVKDGTAHGESTVASTEDPSRDLDTVAGDDTNNGADPEGGTNAAADAASVANTDRVSPEMSPLDEPDPDAVARPTPDALAVADPNRWPMENDRPAVDNAADANPPASEIDQAIDDPAAMLATQAVMMFEVEQTALGRANNAVLQEMRKAGIQADLKQRVNDSVVGYLQKAGLVAEFSEAANGEGASSPVSVVYVEASGKQLDKFMLSLFGDTEQIGRIGWNMAMDAPVVDAATQIQKIVATDVRHAENTSAAWELISGDAPQGFTAPGSSREFFPIDRTDSTGWEAVGPVNSGPDIRSRLLILIR